MSHYGHMQDVCKALSAGKNLEYFQFQHAHEIKAIKLKLLTCCLTTATSQGKHVVLIIPWRHSIHSYPHGVWVMELHSTSIPDLEKKTLVLFFFTKHQVTSINSRVANVIHAN